MNVHGVGNGQAFGHVRQERDRQVTPEAAGYAPAVDTAGKAAGEGGEERAAGVLRLLNEGHFKGVADLRLRINFFDEISRISADKRHEVLETGLAELKEELPTALKDFLAGVIGPEGLSEDDLEAAVSAFWEMADGVAETGKTSLADALQELRAAVSTLIGGLQAVVDTDDGTTTITPVPDSPVAEAEQPATALPETDEATTAAPETDEAASEPLPSTEDPFTALNTWFDTFLATLDENVTNAGALPPLSPPSGNGRAYAKFLEIYNGLTQGTHDGAETGPSAEVLDEVV